MADRHLMRLGLIASVSFGFSVILGNWVVTLLERTEGMSRAGAGAIGSLLLLLGILGRPAGGALVRAFPRLTRRTLGLSFVAGAVGTAIVALSLDPAADAVAAAAAGLAAGIPFGVTVSGAAQAYPAAGGAAVGAMNTYPVLTIVCGAPLVGLGFGLPGHGRIGFAVLAGLWLCAGGLLPRLKSSEERGRYG
jgi:MFS family permease